MTNFKRISVLTLLMICGLLSTFPALTQDEVPLGARVAVARIWEGEVELTKADEYFRYLYNTGIKQMQGMPGNLGVQVLRRPVKTSTQFMVISYWESRDAIRKFAGQDIERAVPLPRDREFLLRPVDTVRHYDVFLTNVSKLQSVN